MKLKYFGTDGFRGKANEGLNVDHAFKIGRFVGWYYGARTDKKARIVLGKDTRRSSYMFESALVAGLVASGADAYMLHVIPTPGVSYVTANGAFDCGIMITASHNPFSDNGIKLVNTNGEKMDDEVLKLVEDYIDGKIDVPLATGDKIGCTVDFMQGRNRYIAYLIASANFSLQGVKVGLDCANGAASSVAKPVFDALGADVYVFNNTPNGFNINVNCGSTHIEEMQSYVLRNNLDVGFAYDGDADRCIAVDERGRVVDGDLILYLCGRYLNKHGGLSKSTVVPTVMSNFGLFKALEEIGINAEKTDVGDKYVYACMRQNGYSLGGEQSGHVLWRHREHRRRHHDEPAHHGGHPRREGDPLDARASCQAVSAAAHQRACGRQEGDHGGARGARCRGGGREVPRGQRSCSRARKRHRRAGAHPGRGAD